MLKNSGFYCVFNVTGGHIEKLIKNNGFLTSRQGIGVPNAGWLKPPAERHRGNAIFGSYQLWIEF